MYNMLVFYFFCVKSSHSNYREWLRELLQASPVHPVVSWIKGDEVHMHIPQGEYLGRITEMSHTGIIVF